MKNIIAKAHIRKATRDHVSPDWNDWTNYRWKIYTYIVSSKIKDKAVNFFYATLYMDSYAWMHFGVQVFHSLKHISTVAIASRDGTLSTCD